MLHLEPDLVHLMMDGIMMAAGLSLPWTAFHQPNRRGELNQSC